LGVLAPLRCLFPDSSLLAESIFLFGNWIVHLVVCSQST
jgi:hypothetical protein